MTFMSFSSFEEMQRFLEEQEAAGNARMSPIQRKITFGDYWVRFLDVAGRVVIFSYVMPLAEIWDEEVRLGASEGEANAVVKATEESHARGYVFGNCFSIVEPTGELGSTHLCNVWPCSEQLYREARMVGWRVDELPMESQLELEGLYQGYRKYLEGVRA